MDSSGSEAEEANEDAAAVNTEVQGGGMAGRLVAGLMARRRVDDEGAGGDRRCQEGAAEARSGLGGGARVTRRASSSEDAPPLRHPRRLDAEASSP